MPMPAQTSAPPRPQRGVYALEWAIVFPVFFMLVYAIVSFGLGFLVRESMQWAVEDGARAALQFKTSRADRQTRALATVKSNLDWLPAELKDTIEGNFIFKVCALNDSTRCTTDMAADAMRCDIDSNNPCMLQVQLMLPYADHPLTPSLTLGLLKIVMPTLRAQAQIVVDQKGF